MRRITAAGILCGVNVAAAFSGTVVTLRGSRCASLAAARSVRVIGAAGVDEKQKEEGVFEPHRPVGRRAVLSEAVTAGLVLGAAAPAGAKEGKAKAGAWAKHEGEFTEQELDGFTETKSGLLFKDIEEGTGVVPQPGQKIKAHYAGYLLESGKKFDSSYDRGKPLPFAVGTGQVIKGWDEGLLTMKVGGKRLLVIPSKLAYGSRPVGGGLIPANSDLVFFVELVTIAA